jgi:hypothetical protein
MSLIRLQDDIPFCFHIQFHQLLAAQGFHQGLWQDALSGQNPVKILFQHSRYLVNSMQHSQSLSSVFYLFNNADAILKNTSRRKNAVLCPERKTMMDKPKDVKPDWRGSASAR